MTTAIKIKNLHKRYAEKVAVTNISFEVAYGEVTALLGSNGAGKSTTLNMIAGILRPTSGEIEFDGMNYNEHYEQIKAKLGYLTCDMSLYKTLSVYENLHFLGKMKGFSDQKIKDRIEFLNEQFDLSQVLKKNYGLLSSGQKQRSLIAASVIHDPDILIFDEVTASLDIVISKSIMDFLLEEKKRGKAIIFSTHILSEVEYISDRILMIDHGILIAQTNFNELIKASGAVNLTEAFYSLIQKEDSKAS